MKELVNFQQHGLMVRQFFWVEMKLLIHPKSGLNEKYRRYYRHHFLLEF